MVGEVRDKAISTQVVVEVEVGVELGNEQPCILCIVQYLLSLWCSYN